MMMMAPLVMAVLILMAPLVSARRVTQCRLDYDDDHDNDNDVARMHYLACMHAVYWRSWQREGLDPVQEHVLRDSGWQRAGVERAGCHPIEFSRGLGRSPLSSSCAC